MRSDTRFAHGKKKVLIGILTMDKKQEPSPEEQPPQAPAAGTEKRSEIAVELNYIPLINLAMHQNAVPMVYELILTNTGLTAIKVIGHDFERGMLRLKAYFHALGSQETDAT